MIDGERRAATPRAGSTTPASPTARPTRTDGRVFIKALRNIAAGEELNYDYGLIIDEPYTKKLKAEFPCWCGAESCRGTLLAPKDDRKRQEEKEGQQEGQEERQGRQALTMAAPWFEDEIAAALAPLLPGLAVEVVAEIDSTNSELMRRARDGRSAPVLLVAERQTAGRGRMGRPWQSAQARGEPASLTFSLGLPLVPRGLVGAFAGGRRQRGGKPGPVEAGRIALKWPNDLWVEDRKLGGILIETALPQNGTAERYLVIGIGLNIGAARGHGPQHPAGMDRAVAPARHARPSCCARSWRRWWTTCCCSASAASCPLPSASPPATSCAAARCSSATAPRAAARAWAGAANCWCRRPRA